MRNSNEKIEVRRNQIKVDRMEGEGKFKLVDVREG